MLISRARRWATVSEAVLQMESSEFRDHYLFMRIGKVHGVEKGKLRSRKELKAHFLTYFRPDTGVDVNAQVFQRKEFGKDEHFASEEEAWRWWLRHVDLLKDKFKSQDKSMQEVDMGAERPNAESRVSLTAKG